MQKKYPKMKFITFGVDDNGNGPAAADVGNNAVFW